MAQSVRLSEGKITPQLITLAVPLLIGTILQQIYNTVDALVIGRYIGNLAFAGVGIAGTVMNLFTFVLSGGCVGVSVFLAQSFGANEFGRFRQTVFLFLLLGSGTALAMGGLGLLLLEPLLLLMQTPQEVMGYSAEYLQVIFMGLFAPFLYHMCAGMLRAVGDTRTALVILLVSMLVHLGLNLLFIPVLGLGIRASALATVLSQSCSAIACIVYLKRRHPDLLCTRADLRWDGPLFARTANFAVSAALHQSSLYLGKLLVQGTVNGLGTDAISAYTAATRVEGFANAMGDSANSALSVFVGQNIGSGKQERVKQGFHITMRLMIGLGLTLSVLLFTTCRWTVAFMLGAENLSALEPGMAYLKAISLFYVLAYVGNSFVGLFRGCGQNALPVIGTAIQMTIRVIGSYLLAGYLGLVAVSVSTGLGWIAIVIFQIICYRHMGRRLFGAEV